MEEADLPLASIMCTLRTPACGGKNGCLIILLKDIILIKLLFSDVMKLSLHPKKLFFNVLDEVGCQGVAQLGDEVWSIDGNLEDLPMRQQR